MGVLRMNNDVGKNISQERHNQDMTQEQLAELSDLTINYLSKVERGVAKQISANTLYKISKALGLSMDSLMNGVKTQPIDQGGPNQRQLNTYLNRFDNESRESISKQILELLKVSHSGMIK